MKNTALLILSQLGITLLLSSVAAADFDPRPNAEKIDSFLNAHLTGKELAPNPTISDEKFVMFSSPTTYSFEGLFGCESPVLGETIEVLVACR